MSTVYAIGIDFGTSNSCVTYATYYEDMNGRLEGMPVHRPEPLMFQHKDTIPTVVFLGDGGEQQPLCGELAEEKAVFFPELTRSGFKLRLGRPGESGRDAYLLSKQFLAYLRARLSEYVPLDQPAQNQRIETIVGHPVQWSVDQREETRRAAVEAGFPNVTLEEEPLAALYSHLCDERGGFHPQPGSQILMIDMGGGTTDFALLQLPQNSEDRPVSTPVDPAALVPSWGGGRTSYGGRDLDQLLLDYLSRDWDPEMVAKERGLLLREVRRFKEAFSGHILEGVDRYETMWLVGEKPVKVSLSRQEFETVAAHYITHFEALVRGALELAKVAPRQVSSLILAGGHSRWYFVDETLKRVFPHITRENFTLLRHNHPEQSVARGLAYVPMVKASGARLLAPVRKSAHSLWLHVPYGSAMRASAAIGPEKRGDENGATSEEPVLILPRGQQLPFGTPRPLRIAVNKLGLDAKEATVNIQLFSSAGGRQRVPLYDRVATFERGRWENLLKRFGTRLPWAMGVDEDQFELWIQCEVDESELLTAEMVIVRYFRGKKVAVQSQKLQVASGSSLVDGGRQAAIAPAWAPSTATSPA
jgi:Hsp70 protein